MPDPPAPDRPGSQGFELRRSDSHVPPPGAPPHVGSERPRPRSRAALAALLLLLLGVAVVVWLLAT